MLEQLQTTTQECSQVRINRVFKFEWIHLSSIQLTDKDYSRWTTPYLHREMDMFNHSLIEPKSITKSRIKCMKLNSPGVLTVTLVKWKMRICFRIETLKLLLTPLQDNQGLLSSRSDVHNDKWYSLPIYKLLVRREVKV